MRRLLAAMAIPVAGVAAAALIPAGTSATILADQPFDGYVNGMKKAVNVVVVGCSNPGDTGLIQAGQTWKVGLGTHGQQGDWDGTVTAKLAGATATLSSYNVDYLIPSAAAPCSGHAAATFTPDEPGIDARTATVGVNFVGIAS